MSILGLVIMSPFLWLGWNCHKRAKQNDEWRAEARERNALSPTEHGELERLLPELHAAVTRATKAFREDITPTTLAAAVPGEAPCPQRAPGFEDLRDDASSRYAYYGNGLELVKPGEQPLPRSVQSTASSLQDLEERIAKDEDGPTKSHLESARALAGELDLILIAVGARTEPMVLADSYMPGTVRGTAYLYSVSARKIICAVDLAVENAPEVKIEYRTSTYDVTGSSNKRAAATAELARDLALRTRRAVANGLRAVR